MLSQIIYYFMCLQKSHGNPQRSVRFSVTSAAITKKVVFVWNCASEVQVCLKSLSLNWPRALAAFAGRDEHRRLGRFTNPVSCYSVWHKLQVPNSFCRLCRLSLKLRAFLSMVYPSYPLGQVSDPCLGHGGQTGRYS